jgi:hypothetical protein
MAARRGRAAVAALAAALCLALTGCESVSRFFDDMTVDEADRNSDGQIASSGEVGVENLAVGDCVVWGNQIDAESVTELDVVPCDQPHDVEVYAVFDLSGDAYEGEERVVERADAGCYDEFARFVGLPYDESELEFSYIYPSEESWDYGDHGVLCQVGYPAPRQATGTLRAYGQ